jgi:hypothetical protein
MSYRALQFTPCNTGATPQFGFRSHETGGSGLFWIWADLSLIYLKGFSPLRTNRDRALKRKPGNWRRADRKYHFARKKHFKAAIDSRLFRGNTVSLSGRKGRLSWRPRRFG